MFRSNILQYLTKMLRQYFNCNEILEIFLTSFCNILCYVGSDKKPERSSCVFEVQRRVSFIFGLVASAADDINRKRVEVCWSRVVVSDFYEEIPRVEKMLLLFILRAPLVSQSFVYFDVTLVL